LTQRKLVHGFLAALLVMMQLLTLLQIRSVHAVEQPSVKQTLVDTQDLSLDVEGVQNGDVIDWTLNYERPITAANRALKLDVKANDTTISPRDPTNWQQLQAVDPQWWQESDFSTQAKGSLHYQTPINQSSLTITAQLDEQTTTQVDAATLNDTENETTETTPQVIETPQAPSVTTDLLAPEIAGPHTVTLEIPEAEVDEPIPDPDDQAAQAEATSESVVTPDLKSQPVATDVADEIKTKATQGTVIEPDTTNTLLGTNLVLTLDAFSNVAMNVTNSSGTGVGRIYPKNVGPSNDNYDSFTKLTTITSRNYVAGSNSVAIVFNSEAIGTSANIQMSYDNVGYAQLADGTVTTIGARVSISDMVYRPSDWQDVNADKGKMAMDFSTNFYSGMQLTNVRKFNWNVTFFEVKSSKAINFQKDTAAMLTFTSLNPGEFVKPESTNLTFSTSDPNSVKKTDLGASEAPNSATQLQGWIARNWVNNTTAVVKDAYTSHKWGDWELTTAVNPNTTWADKLGEPTFANGAAAFSLDGTTFKFTRGTYFSGNTTWLANASGGPIYEIPKDLAINKSISAKAHDGGGTSQDAANSSPFTPNDLHLQNINAQALADDEMYYYVNVQTYSLGGELLAYPDSITISDTLPEGMDFYDNSVAEDIVIFNEHSNDTTKPKTLSTKNTTISGRTLRVHLDKNEVKNIPFARGYITVRIRVKTSYDPNTITQQVFMHNKATVNMLGPDKDKEWNGTSNTVTVDVTPNKVNAEFKKVDGDNEPLKGAEFQLFDNAQTTGDPLRTATSDNQGIVRFTGVKPGDYWLKETKTPTGYVTLNRTLKITIQNDGTIKWPADWTSGNKVVNKVKPWTIELEKTDDQQKRLSGAEFTLTKVDGTEIDQGTTNGNSALTFNTDEMLPGDYVLTETKAPTGFEKLNGEFTFTLNLNGKVSNFTYTGDDLTPKQYTYNADNHLLALTVENNSETIPLPVTGGNGIQALLAFAVVIMLMALMLGWHWRKEAHR
jgi:hypothetical protein